MFKFVAPKLVSPPFFPRDSFDVKYILLISSIFHSQMQFSHYLSEGLPVAVINMMPLMVADRCKFN